MKIKGEIIMSKVYTSVLDLIGHTPLLEPVKFGADKNLQARLLVKLESFNPAVPPRTDCQSHDRRCGKTGRPEKKAA